MTHLPPFRTGHGRREQGHCTPVPGLDLPFTVIEGPTPGPVLLVTAGVHGSEFCSIEAALRLARLTPEELRGTLVVLPLLNPGGFRARSVYVMPEDGKNLNRMFPGRPDGSLSEQLAHWLVTAVYPQVDAYLDLHGGDLDESLAPFSLYPRIGTAAKIRVPGAGAPHAEEPPRAASRSTQGLASFDTAAMRPLSAGFSHALRAREPQAGSAQDEGGWSVRAASKALAAVFGLPVAVEAGGEGYTINAAGQLGIPSVIAEVGGNGLWDEVGVAALTDGAFRVMRHLGMIDREVPPAPGPAPRFVTMWVPPAPVTGLWYPAVDIEETVAVGALLGEIRDVFGEVLARVRSERAGAILYRLTSLSVNAGEALLGVGSPLGDSRSPTEA